MIDLADGHVRTLVDFKEMLAELFQIRRIIAQRVRADVTLVIGSEEETLLWMLLSCLLSYLSVSDLETPCFTGIPTAETYRQAILFVLKDRKTEDFDAEKYLDLLKAK